MTNSPKAKKPQTQKPAVKNKVMSDTERRQIAFDAMQRSYKPVIQKALDARNEALKALLLEVYDAEALEALKKAPPSLIQRRRTTMYEYFRGQYSGHELRIIVLRKTTDNEYLISDRFPGLPEMLPRDAMPSEINLTSGQKEAIRLAKEFVQRTKDLGAAEVAANDARKEIERTLLMLKRSGAAAQALPEIADIIASVVGSPPKPVVPAEQVEKVRSMLKVAA